MFVFGLTHRVLKAVPRVLSGGWLYANTIVSFDFLVILYDTAEGKVVPHCENSCRIDPIRQMGRFANSLELCVFLAINSSPKH